MHSGSTRSRRSVLAGLGVTLALPWLESLAPRSARAQAASIHRRFIPVFFPMGSPNYWRPVGEGAGDAWQLSPILDPLAKLKPHVTVVSNVENYSPFGTVRSVEPSHPLLGAAFLTCAKTATNKLVPTAGISADQVLARALAAETSFPSLQLGLSTRDGTSDDAHPAAYRSVSWSSANEPLYKTVNPQAVFDRLVSAVPATGGAMTATPDPVATRRRSLRKSALDYVLDSATATQKRLGVADQAKLEQFLSSVRELEKRVSAPVKLSSGRCTVPTRPMEAFTVGKATPGYNRNTHADLIFDLVVMAVQCDLTRVVSVMTDDEGSQYGYGFVPMRRFTATGSTPDGTMVSGDYHGIQHSGDRNDNFATVTRWNVEKVARLCERLAEIQEGDRTLLDNSVVFFGSGMQGGSHAPHTLPLLVVGSGGGILARNQHVVFKQERRLSDIYFTFLQQVFKLPVPAFANSRAVVTELLA